MQRITTYAAPAIFLITILALTSGCSRQPPAHSAHFNTFGEIALITVIGATQEKAKQAVIETQELLHNLESAWNPAIESDLHYTNQKLGQKEIFVAPPSIAPLVEMSQRYFELSKGNFDPASGKYLQLWGVYDNRSNTSSVPADDEIDAVLKSKPTIADIAADGFFLQTSKEDLLLDFGPLKKAYAMELCKQSLVNAGAHDALLKIGGDTITIGTRSGESWHMVIPRGDGTGVLGTMRLGYNEAGFTVSANSRTFIRDKKVFHPIIDPKTGKPVTHTLSVTVVHKDATRAAAGAQAIFVSGPQEWEKTATAMGIKQVLLIDRDNVIHVTPELKERFKLDVPHSQLVISPL